MQRKVGHLLAVAIIVIIAAVTYRVESYRATLCYSAVFTVVVCLSVCPLVCLSQAETTERIELVYGRDTYANPTLCSEESPPSEIRALSSRLRTHGKSVALSTKLVDGRARCRRVVAFYYTSVDRITL